MWCADIKFRKADVQAQQETRHRARHRDDRQVAQQANPSGVLLPARNKSDCDYDYGHYADNDEVKIKSLAWCTYLARKQHEKWQ